MTAHTMEFMMVRWVDSNRTGREWTEIEDYRGSHVHCVSAGWIVHEDDEQVTLCGNLAFGESKPEGFVHGMTIPKKSIVDAWVVEGMTWDE